MTAILELFRDPAAVAGWGVAEWRDALPRLRQAELLAHAADRIETAGVGAEALPPAVRRQFAAAVSRSEAQRRSVVWELEESRRALAEVGIRAVPLKGADYLLRGATPARGRMMADLDLLVAPEEVDRALAALCGAGWETPSGELIEGRHQVPTLMHGVRRTLLDLHHQVIGVGGAVTFDVGEVLATARRHEGVHPLLTPVDGALVSVAHFARNRRAVSVFRDLLDLHELIADGEREGRGFAAALGPRAAAVGLGGALALALAESYRLFGGAMPAALGDWAAGVAPLRSGAPATCLIPDGASRPSLGVRLQRLGWYYARMRSTHGRRAAARAAWRTARGDEVD